MPLAVAFSLALVAGVGETGIEEDELKTAFSFSTGDWSSSIGPVDSSGIERSCEYGVKCVRSANRIDSGPVAAHQYQSQCCTIGGLDSER